MRSAWWLGALAFILVTCRRPLELPPTPSVTPPPMLTVVTPTFTPTRTPTPSVTPTPSATPTLPPTLTPEPSPTPEGRLGPNPWPAGLNPLTGLPAEAAALDRRPLAVKVVNMPPCSRPQYGLGRADLVFEHYVEAWGTRLTAIYYGQEAERVGAVRSARLIDLELPAIFNGLLVTSGSSDGVKKRLLASDFSDRIISAEFGAHCPPLCRVPIESVACADLEHTLFSDTRDLHAAAVEQGQAGSPGLSGWAFSPAPLTPGEPAERLKIGYFNAPVEWTFDAASGRYLRTQDGRRQVDALTSSRLASENVLVLFAHHLYSDIRESANFYSLEIQFWGQGPLLLVRDGQLYRGEWRRSLRSGLFEILDAAGQPLPLKPGQSWFEFVPLNAATQSSGADWTVTAPLLPPLAPPP